MTEIERIIKEGILSENFFREETRNDFFIDIRRKKIWAVLIDLLLQFDKVCQKHNLKYFLMYGTLLGAVRHQGFIPWDDDIDVGMVRDDYEKFLLIAKEEFKDPYFFQTPFTDEGAFYSMAKLRNSNTCCVQECFRYEKFNQGLTLDIFPFDYCNLNEIENNFKRIKQINIDNSSYMRKSHPKLEKEDLKRVQGIKGLDPLARWKEMNAIATQYKKPTEHMACAVSTISDWRKQIFFTADLSHLTKLDFEGLKFSCPVEYDRILTTLYGEYMAFPPVKERGTWHNKIYMDADISYKDYINTQ